MDADDVVEFLTWLEGTFQVQFNFRDKDKLADDFVEQRSYRTYDEYQRQRAVHRVVGGNE